MVEGVMGLLMELTEWKEVQIIESYPKDQKSYFHFLKQVIIHWHG